MFTGNYNLLRNNAGLIKRAVSISLTSPSWIRVNELPELMPSWNLLKMFQAERINEEDYIRIYASHLEKLNPENVKEQLYRMTKGEEPILMCWCGQNDFCHRHLAADWIEEKLGIEVKEFSKKKFKREKGHIYEDVPEHQLNMFE